MSHMNRMGETGCSSLIAKFYIKITFHLDFTLFTSIYILVYSHGIGFLILIFHCPKCHVHVCTNVVSKKFLTTIFTTNSLKCT